MSTLNPQNPIEPPPPRHMAPTRGPWAKFRRATGHPVLVIAAVLLVLAVPAGITWLSASGSGETALPDQQTEFFPSKTSDEPAVQVLAATAKRGLAIALVPPVPGYRMRVAGTILTADVDGVVFAPDASGVVPIGLLVYDADRTQARATLVSWSNGSTRPLRTIDTATSPIVQVGVKVEYLVTAAPADPARSNPSEPFVFESPFGEQQLSAGVPSWITPTIAVPAEGGFEPQASQYTLTNDPSQTFVALPGALWAVEQN